MLECIVNFKGENTERFIFQAFVTRDIFSYSTPMKWFC